MRIIYVGNEEMAIAGFSKVMELSEEKWEIHTFSDEKDVLDFLEREKTDIAFVDMDMQFANGIRLAREMQELQSEIKIVFIADNDAYALEAFEVNAVGYLLKPCTQEQILGQIRRIQDMFHMGESRSVYFQTMPRFEVYVDGKLMPLTKKKVKELLALLVDAAGSSLTSEQLITYLWEDRIDDESTKALLRMTAKRLRDILLREEIDFILIEENGVRAVDVRKVSCDYYDILSGNEEAMEKYHGEYMLEYSWAEFTNERLRRIVESWKNKMGDSCKNKKIRYDRN